MNEEPLKPGPTGLRRSFQRHPALWALFVTAAVLVSAVLWPLWRGLHATPGPGGAPEGLPWQVLTTADGESRVFGLQLGSARLVDVESMWGGDLVVAMIAESGKAPALEAYVESFQAAFLTGKLVLAFDADAAWLARAWARSARGDLGAAASPEAGAVRKRELTPDDWAEARRFRVAALSFLPSARLDEATVARRFGPPTERLADLAGGAQLLYPALGVAVALPPAAGEGSRARSVIQYVPPRDFERRLRAPLLAPSTLPAKSPL